MSPPTPSSAQRQRQLSGLTLVDLAQETQTLNHRRQDEALHDARTHRGGLRTGAVSPPGQPVWGWAHALSRQVPPVSFQNTRLGGPCGQKAGRDQKLCLLCSYGDTPVDPGWTTLHVEARGWEGPPGSERTDPDDPGGRGAHTRHLSWYSFRTSENRSSWARSSVLCGSSWKPDAGRRMRAGTSGQAEGVLSPPDAVPTRLISICRYSRPSLLFFPSPCLKGLRAEGCLEFTEGGHAPTWSLGCLPALATWEAPCLDPAPPLPSSSEGDGKGQLGGPLTSPPCPPPPRPCHWGLCRGC